MSWEGGSGSLARTHALRWTPYPQMDSNHRPAVCRTAALPLSYRGKNREVKVIPALTVLGDQAF